MYGDYGLLTKDAIMQSFNNAIGQPNNLFESQTLNIIKTHGKQGVDCFKMPPNTKAFLLDGDNPIGYLVQTDGTGYKTTTLFHVFPFDEKEVAEAEHPELAFTREMNDKMSALEERLNKIEVKLNEQSDIRQSESSIILTK